MAFLGSLPKHFGCKTQQPVSVEELVNSQTMFTHNTPKGKYTIYIINNNDDDNNNYHHNNDDNKINQDHNNKHIYENQLLRMIMINNIKVLQGALKYPF